MKQLFHSAGLGLLLLISIAGLRAQDAPTSLSFNGVTFTKAFSDKTVAGPFSEYLPKGQKFETWTKLMGYYHFVKLTNPKAGAVGLAEQVKVQNPQAQARVITNDAGDMAIVDFVTWPEGEAYVEFNIWKYRKASGGGLIGIQYAERTYSNFETFFKELGNRRSKLIEVMAGTEL